MDKQDNPRPRRPSSFLSRVFLVLINVIAVVFGVVLLYSGATGLLAAGKHEIPGVVNPFAVVIGIGAIVLLISVFGLCGAYCALSKDDGGSATGLCWSNRFLFIYYVAILFASAGLLYAALLCFLFTEKANDYVLAVFGSANKTTLPIVGSLSFLDAQAMVESNSKSAGAVCIASLVVNLICARSGAAVMGYKWTAKRTLLATNVVGFLLGIAMIILAFLPALKNVAGVSGELWLGNTIGSCGVFVSVLCLFGLVAVWRQHPWLLLVNAGFLSVLSAVVFAMGVYALVNAASLKSSMNQHMLAVKEHLVDVCPDCLPSRGNFTDCCVNDASMLVWNNMTVLGLACSLTLLFMLVSIAASLYLYRQRRREIAERRASEQERLVSRQGARDRSRQQREAADDDEPWDEPPRRGRGRGGRGGRGRGPPRSQRRRQDDYDDDEYESHFRDPHDRL